MKSRKSSLLVLVLAGTFILNMTVIAFNERHAHTVIHASPIPTVPAQPAAFPPEYIAALDVARIFGRSTGCAEADPKLITTVAQEAVKAQLDPRILAATIAVESGCRQFATSPKGAIGLTQVMPTIWKDKYDFEHKYNLLNPQDNITVGADILGNLVKQYGAINGLRHYNGLGTDCTECDAGYVDRISALAAKR